MRLAWLILLLGSSRSALAQQAPIDAGPEAAPGVRAIGSLVAAEIGPGRTIRLHAGHYATIVVPLTGTAAAPVMIEGAGDGMLTLDGPIVLDHAAFVTVRGLHIAHAADAAIVLREGSHDVSVRGNDIEDARLGIWIGQNAGDNNRIEDNVIRRSVTHGIAVDAVNAVPGRETTIARNRVDASGIHGIELSGNYYVIDGNIVSGSGRLSTSASGIHVFAKNAGQGVGKHNVIQNNFSYDNHDASAQDGNGIQLDQWCDDNLVTNNIAANNDGAGISVFDAARAHIVGNRLNGNMRDPGGSHRHKGELVFATDDEHDADNTRDGLAERNIVAARDPAIAAILVDTRSSRHPPRFGNNLFWNAAGGAVARWAGRNISSIESWNALAPHAAPDITGDPAFADPSRLSPDGFVTHRTLPNLGAPRP